MRSWGVVVALVWPAFRTWWRGRQARLVAQLVFRYRVGCRGLWTLNSIRRFLPLAVTIWCTIWSMGRKEVLVQLDDDLIDRLDRLAVKQGTSRSELLRRGAAAVLEAAEHAEADRALQEAYRRVPQDPAVVSAATRLAALTAPEW